MLPCFFDWTGDCATFVILLNDIMDCGSTHVEPWHHSTLVCILCDKISSLLRSDTYGLVLWFGITQRHRAHTGTNRLIHSYEYIYINTTCAQSSCLYYIEWIIFWYKKINLHSSRMILLFKNYSLVEVTYLLIRFNKTKFLSWNTKNTDRNDINKQNTHMHMHPHQGLI